ncbi:MAG: cell division protein FtsA [Clostridiales bacterium]|jgi:cell division protein FtsA|nr:cell division protein FtsA [Clostridiales bacterium]
MVVAIDIGTSKICALCGQIGKAGQLETIARSVIPCGGVKKGLIVDMEAVSGAISEAVRQAETGAGIKIGSAYVGVMGMYVDMRANRSSMVNARENREIQGKDIERLLYAARDVALPEDAQILYVIPRQYVIDGYGGIMEPVGMVGVNVELEADIVAGKNMYISNIVSCMSGAGVKIDGLVLSGEALGQMILSREEMEMGVILIDVGGSVTDVSVFKKGRLIMYESVPVGGDHITNDISIGMKMSYAEADKIKKDYNLALTSLIRKDQELYVVDINNNLRKRVVISEIIEVIEARVFEIMSMCKDLLGENKIEFSFGAGVVLTGGGIACFDGNKHIAGEVFRLPVRVFPPRMYGSQRAASLLAEGIVKHVSAAGAGGGGRFGSDVQVLKRRDIRAGGALLRRIVELLKRIF